MRLARVACVCALALAWPAALAGNAAAFAHPSPNRRCQITLTAPRPWQIRAGEPVTIAGQLRCRPHHRGSSDQTVELFQRLGGTSGFTVVQSTTTNAAGEYEFTIPDVETSRVYYVRSRGARSDNRRVRVEARVTLAGPPEGTQIFTGAPNSVTFTGTVSPADVGARVVLQRQSATGSDEWHTIGFGLVEPGEAATVGKFTIIHRFLVPGDADIRVLVRSQGRNVASPSSPLTYVISQAENPALTVSASPDPIAYGQSTTIAGKLEGGKGQTVTLYEHTVGDHGQRGYSPVAQATAGENGEYTFPVQSPLNSTYYRVKGAGKVSAILFESVKYALSVSASATSVQEGQPVIFSGSVAPTPSDPEHALFIERQGPDGEFHVVHVGYLNSTSQFAIPYQPFTLGTVVLRVRVTGGPANGSTISQPFPITVTPVPPGTMLPAEAPGNTSLPPSGSAGHEKAGANSEGGEKAELEAEGVGAKS